MKCLNFSHSNEFSWLIFADYTEVGGNEELPLGKEFQEHMLVFVRENESPNAKYCMARKLIDQLS